MSDGPFDKAPTGDSSRTIPLNPLPDGVGSALVSYLASLIDGADVVAAGERLRAAIRTACVAAERRGIERAAAVCKSRAKSLFDQHDGWTEAEGEAAKCELAIRALPVPESTEADHG